MPELGQGCVDISTSDGWLSSIVPDTGTSRNRLMTDWPVSDSESGALVTKKDCARVAEAGQ